MKENEQEMQHKHAVPRFESSKEPELQKVEKPTYETVEETLQNRREIYGHYSEVAAKAARLREVFYKNVNKEDLLPEVSLGIDMILLKLARLASGNVAHIDTWHDIAGYATLVEDTLQQIEKLSRAF